MKKLVAILLVVSMIMITLAFAINISETTADPTAVRGRGVDASQVESQIDINNTTETLNITTDTGSTESATVEDSVTSTQAIQVPDYVSNLNETETIIPENLTTIPQKDTTGIVMQSTGYSCGPAALATVLQNMGFNVTEGELKVLAGTDETGTSMYSLVRAAQAKGLSAVGMRLTVDELRPDNIVHVTIDGTPHYSVVREVTENSVKLADPSLGNIEMSREKFSEIFSGNVLVITDPNIEAPGVSVNITSTNNTDDSVQPENSQILTAETMETIRGRIIKKAVILAAIGAIKTKVISIAKAAWGAGKRGVQLIRRIENAILRRVPFANHRRVRNAARGAASALTVYVGATLPWSRFCWKTAGKYTFGGALSGFLWGT